MTIPALPPLDRTSATFKTDLDAFFLTQLPATIPAFNAEIERVNQFAFGSYSATSSTSLTVGTGSKTLTIDAGKGFAVGQPVLIASTASPTNCMSGQVTAYNSGTGAMTVNVTAIGGSGTVASWAVSVSAVVLAPVPSLLQRPLTGADTLISSDHGKLINCSGTFTLSVTAAATLGNGWWCYVRNTSNGDVPVDPASPEQIDGATTYVLKPGFTVLVACDGAAFTTLKVKERTYTNIASYTASGTFVVPADTYVIRGYAWGKGGDGTSTTSGGGGGCAYGDIAVAPGETVTITISSNIAKVITSATDRLTGNPASGVTAGTASKHASVTNGGAYSGGAGVGSSSGAGAASGSPLGVGGEGQTGGGAAWGGFHSAGYEHGAGVGQNAVNAASGGSGRTPLNTFTDPLLAPLISPPAYTINVNAANGVNGGPGAGGSAASSAGNYGGNGGIGAGGGRGGPGSGGSSVFGGGGAQAFSGPAGDGGLGGGGGGAGSTPGTGGAACVLIYY